MNRKKQTTEYRKAFSLIEVIVALTMASMIMITTITIYSQVRKAVAAVNEKMGSGNIATDVLQLIAEDIDRLSTSGMDTTIKIQNKAVKGLHKSQMIITSRI